MSEDLKQRLESFLVEQNQPKDIAPVTPDASTREYFRMLWNDTPAIACVYPFNDLCQGQFAACLDVTKVFLTANLPVPRIFASDDEKQIIIQEDFGDTILREVLEISSVEKREDLLNEAITLIAKIQAATPIAFEVNSIASRLMFDKEKLLWELFFFKTHYFESLLKKPLSESDNSKLEKEFTELSIELENHARVLTHRDFHAANLMMQKDEMKIIDHQDARIGAASYDLVSLLLDRVTALPSPEWLDNKRNFFLIQREKLGLESLDRENFAHEFRLQTIQRCLKAIGTFSFQSTFRGKKYFIQYIKPMFQTILRAAEDCERFPFLRSLIFSELNS